MAEPGRFLVVNADDFGYTADVNRGIVEAHRNGILTATTLMANGPAFEDAVQLGHHNPALDIGVHLVLFGGKSLLPPYQPYPCSFAGLTRAIVTRQLDPHMELRAQIEKVLQAGLQPTHLDTHKHTHLLPQVLQAVARLGREFGIRWIRRPFDFPITDAAIPVGRQVLGRTLSFLRPKFHQLIKREGCRTTDAFAGFQLTGHLSAAGLIRVIERLPPGSTEFMCHPGYCTEDLRRSPTRLKESREEELRALTHPDVRTALTTNGVRLCSYRDLDSV